MGIYYLINKGVLKNAVNSTTNVQCFLSHNGEKVRAEETKLKNRAQKDYILHNMD